MRRSLVFLSAIAGFIAVADGLAMILPGTSSGAAGAVLLTMGSIWLLQGWPRLLRPAARPFARAALALLGAVIVPVLALPVAGLWWVATPSALTAWFAVAWSALWLVCAIAVLFVACPECSEPFFRKGLMPRIGPLVCAHCGKRPVPTAAQRVT